MKYLISFANKASTTYFYAVLFGYILAIITTTIVMIVFDHAQPALLYLVPGCLISVYLLALIKGEFSKVWTFDEEIFLKIKDE